MPDTNAAQVLDSAGTAPPPPSVWADARHWYWRHFLKGVCFHLPLMLLLVVLFLLPFNVAGEEFGVIQLVWHEHWWKRFLVGAAMGVVGLEGLFVSYILWLRDGDEGRLGPRQNFRPVSFDWFVVRTLACLCLTLLVLFTAWQLVEHTDAFGLAVGPKATEEASKRVWIAKSPNDPRRVWVAAADPDPTAPGFDRLLLVAALPLGVLSVGAAVWLSGRCGLGNRVAKWRLLKRGRQKLEQLDEQMRGVDHPGWSWWQLGGVVVVSVAWLAALIASLRREASGALLAFSIIGLALFWLGLWFDDREGVGRRRRIGWAFWANLCTHAAFAFIWVTFCLSAYGWWAGLLAALGAAVVAVALAVALPGPTGAWLALFRRVRPYDPDATPAAVIAPAGPRNRTLGGRFRDICWALIAPPNPIPDAFQMWPFVLLSGLGFFLLCNIPRWASPGPIVCFLLFGLILAYGAATVVVRRTIPVAITGLVFFAILAGVQPYKFRYDGYQTEEGEWVAGLPYKEPVDLRDLVQKDKQRQAKFDEALAAYEPARIEYLDLEQEYFANKMIRCSGGWAFSGPRVVPYLPVPVVSLDRMADEWQAYPGPVISLDLWVDAWRVLPGLESRRDAARQKYTVRRQAARDAWLDMERNNRVIAARHARPDMDLNFLNEPDPQRTSERLLTTTDWTLDAVPKGQPLVVIAVSGGGMRSAAWTFTVLRTLEERFAEQGVDFPAHVRIITGASGGMLGAAYYVATLPACRPVTDPGYRANRKKQLDDLYTELTSDDLTALVKQQVYEDVPNLFSPWPARHDRGKELERVWSRNLRGVLDVPIGQLRADEKAGRRPSLVFTPMMIEDGRRLIVSNLDLRRTITHEGNLLLEDDIKENYDPFKVPCHSRDAIELFRLFPESSKDVRLSTAVRMSASFPIFSPAVSLPVSPRRRIVDAGYYDNYGVSLAAAWLISSDAKSWIVSHASKVLLIQIRDGVDQPWRRLDQVDADSSSGPSRSTEELSSPLEGLYNARIASSSFRNDNQLQLLTRFWIESFARDLENVTPILPEYRLFQVVNFELPQRAALSWYLSTSERQRIEDAMKNPISEGHYEKRIDKIWNWWNGPFKFDVK